MSLLTNPFGKRAAVQHRVATACLDFLVIPRGGWEEWRHPFWVLGLAPPWPQRMRVGHTEFVRRENSCVLLAPGLPHQVLWEEGKPFAPTWVFIEERGRPSLLQRLVRPDGFCNFDDPSHAIEPLIHQIVAEFQNPQPGGDWITQAALYQMIGFLLRAEVKADGWRRITKLGAILDKTKERFSLRHQVVSYLRNHLGQKVAIRDIARHLRMSVSSFTHRYRREAGETFGQTKERISLEKARVWLLGGEMSIKQIAAALGYSNSAHFSNRFKAATGFSPGEFGRRNVRQ